MYIVQHITNVLYTLYIIEFNILHVKAAALYLLVDFNRSNKFV